MQARLHSPSRWHAVARGEELRKQLHRFEFQCDKDTWLVPPTRSLKPGPASHPFAKARPDSQCLPSASVPDVRRQAHPTSPCAIRSMGRSKRRSQRRSSAATAWLVRRNAVHVIARSHAAPNVRALFAALRCMDVRGTFNVECHRRLAGALTCVSRRRVWVRPSVLSLMLLPIVLGRVLLPRLLFPAAREGEVVERSPTLPTAWSLRAWSPCRTCLRCATRPLPHSNGPRCEVQPGMESAALFGRAAVYVLVGGAAARDHDGDALKAQRDSGSLGLS
jgi:hypothetical protein